MRAAFNVRSEQTTGICLAFSYSIWDVAWTLSNLAKERLKKNMNDSMEISRNVVFAAGRFFHVRIQKTSGTRRRVCTRRTPVMKAEVPISKYGDSKNNMVSRPIAGRKNVMPIPPHSE